MALFSKLNEKMAVGKIKETAVNEELNFEKIEKELVFGELSTLIEDIEAIDNNQFDVLKRLENVNTTDIPEKIEDPVENIIINTSIENADLALEIIQNTEEE